MDKSARLFATPEQWHTDASQRATSISESEILQRQQLADAHNREHGISDPGTLADQQLYIHGKMELEEYQEYLLFKHSHKRTPLD